MLPNGPAMKRVPKGMFYSDCWPLAFFIFFFVSVAKTYSFAIFGCRVGVCELQMCMALCIGIIELSFNQFSGKVNK